MDSSYYSSNLSPSSIHHHMSYASSLAPSGSNLGSITPPIHSTSFPPTSTPSTTSFSLSSSSHNNNINSSTTTSIGLTPSAHTKLDINNDDLFINQLNPFPYTNNFISLNLLTPSTTNHPPQFNSKFFQAQTPSSPTIALVSLDDFNPSSMSSSPVFDQSFSPVLSATHILCSSSQFDQFDQFPPQTDQLYPFSSNSDSNTQYYQPDYHSNTNTLVTMNLHSSIMDEETHPLLPLPQPTSNSTPCHTSNVNIADTMFSSYLSSHHVAPIINTDPASFASSSISVENVLQGTEQVHQEPIIKPTTRRKKPIKASKATPSVTTIEPQPQPTTAPVQVQPPEPVRRGRKPKAQLEELRAQQQAQADLANSLEIRIEKLIVIFETHLFSILGPNRTFHLSRASNKLIRAEIRAELIKNSHFECDFQTDQIFIQSLLQLLFPPATAAAASSLVTATLAATLSPVTSTNSTTTATSSSELTPVSSALSHDVPDTRSSLQVQSSSQALSQDPIDVENMSTPSFPKSTRKRTYSTLQKVDSSETTTPNPNVLVKNVNQTVQSDTEVTHKSSRIRHTPTPTDSLLSPSPSMSATDTSSGNHRNSNKGSGRAEVRSSRQSRQNVKLFHTASHSDSYGSDSEDSSGSASMTLSSSDFVSLSSPSPSTSTTTSAAVMISSTRNKTASITCLEEIERIKAFEALSTELQRLRLEHSLQQQFILYQHKTQLSTTPIISRSSSTSSNPSSTFQVPSVTSSPSLAPLNVAGNAIASTSFLGHFDQDHDHDEESHALYIEPLPLTDEFSSFVAKNRFQLLQSLHVDSMVLDSCVQSVHDSFEKCLE